MRLLLPTLLALVLVPAALSGSPRVQTISGTVSADTGATITVTSGDRSLTCRVLGEKAQTAILRWSVGVRAAMACKSDGDRLVLSRLTRLGTKEHNDTGTTTTGEPPTNAPAPTPAPARRDARGEVSALGAVSLTVTRDGGTSLTCSVTADQAREIAKGAPVGTVVLIVCTGDGVLISLQRVDASQQPAPTPPPTAPAPTPPPPTAPDRRDARGVVTSLSSDSVTVKPDAGGDSLRCRITSAPDSTAAAAKLSLGAHVGISCRRDGDGYVLAGTTPIT